MIALIFGVCGQDGSYLADLLLSTGGYIVHGVKRRSSSFNTQRIDHLMHRKDFVLHHGDVTDSISVARLIRDIRPNEIYNLAAQSHVAVSFEVPEYTADADALGAMRIIEAIRAERLHEARFYQASTSEIFGRTPPMQSESSPFAPCSPYAVAKLYAHWSTVNARDAYGLHASCGILFNHESARRGETFVTRKITRGVAAFWHGHREPVTLGDVDAVRDWGHARDYVEAMWMMLQQDSPDDYVIATGKSRTVREFATAAFQAAGFGIDWIADQGGRTRAIVTIAPKGRAELNGQTVVDVDPRHLRPLEPAPLCGDTTKARHRLGWMPHATFEDMVEEMVSSDIEYGFALSA